MELQRRCGMTPSGGLSLVADRAFWQRRVVNILLEQRAGHASLSACRRLRRGNTALHGRAAGGAPGAAGGRSCAHRGAAQQSCGRSLAGGATPAGGVLGGLRLTSWNSGLASLRTTEMLPVFELVVGCWKSSGSELAHLHGASSLAGCHGCGKGSGPGSDLAETPLSLGSG